MNFCVFCLSNITEYSKCCLLVMTSMKALLQKSTRLCNGLEVLYGDLWAYLCQVCLSMHFVMKLNGFGQSELSSADTVDLRSVLPTL